MSIHKHNDTIFVGTSFLKDNLSFLEVDKLSWIQGLLQFLYFNYLLQFWLCENFHNYVISDNIFETVSKASFYILGAHRYYFHIWFCHQGVCSHSSFNQDWIFTKTVSSFQLKPFFFDDNSSLFDHIEGVSIVSLVENDLFFFIGFCKAATGNSIFLVLSQVLEEGKNLQKFSIFFIILLIDIIHDFPECFSVDVDHLAIS